MTASYQGRLGLQQRVLPNYRVPFFDLLAGSCRGGLSVFAGEPRRNEAIVGGQLQVARAGRAANVHILAGPLYLCHQRGFMEWLRIWDPDALIVEANPRYLATGRAARWMHARGRGVIGWGLGAPPLSGVLQNGRKTRRRQFLNQFDALIAYSQRGAQEYNATGFPGGRIFVAPNSVAPAPSRMPDRGPASNQAMVLFVGRLQARKHVDSLVRACADMPEPRPRLVLVGDGPERPHLEQLAQRVYPATQFAGARHGEELEPYFRAADLLVLPGTGGLAVQEAMAHGLPVIVARGDGTQDDLVREANGWQIAPDDYESLVSGLRNALSDRIRLRRMGEESYRIVSEEINIGRMVEVFIQALNSLKLPPKPALDDGRIEKAS